MDPSTNYNFTLLGSEVQLLKNILTARSYLEIGALMNKLLEQLNAQIPAETPSAPAES